MSAGVGIVKPPDDERVSADFLNGVNGGVISSQVAARSPATEYCVYRPVSVGGLFGVRPRAASI